MSEENTEQSAESEFEARRHFLVDINTVLNLFGKRFFLIFYFGKHLHPRQQTLVNQRTTGNWLVLLFVGVLVAGFVYGLVQMVVWRLDHAPAPGGNSFTHLALPAPSQT